MATSTAQPANATDQRAGTCPIAFIMEIGPKSIYGPLYLPIRPEDLTLSKPSRVAVHQTLGRDVAGWVDNFGEGLPTINISGHTGWRQSRYLQMDGAEAFAVLQSFLTENYHDTRQNAINAGADPASIRLLFIDTLNDNAFVVEPTQFVLKRSKSRPLLRMYNITLQVIGYAAYSNVVKVKPINGYAGNGVVALKRATTALADLVPFVLPTIGGTLGGALSELVGGFLDFANDVLGDVVDFVNQVEDLATSEANGLIGLASDVASVGLNLFRAMSALRALPTSVTAEFSRVSSAFNEMVCIFQNSLKPRPIYASYSGLYGASNCSSTTGGSPPSPYANLNVFELITARGGSLSLSSSAAASVAALKNMDPVLSPMSQPEIERHMTAIMAGIGS